MKQIIKYIELISILNIYKDNLEFSLKTTPLSTLCEYCKMNINTEKIFCLITDGDYIILKNIYKEILPDLIESNIKDVNYLKQKKMKKY